MRTIGANIVLEGEQSYREALKTINAEHRMLNSEMELSAQRFEGEANSIDALEEKYHILTEQIENQKDKVNVFSEAVESATQRQQASAQSMEELAQQLEAARSEMSAMESSSEATAEAIGEQNARVQTLEAAYRATSEQLQQDTRDVTYWQTALNGAESELLKLENTLEKTDGYLEEAREAADGTTKSLDAFGNEIEEGAENAGRFGEILGGTLASDLIMTGLEKLADLAKQAGEGLYEMATGAAYWADSINTMSTNTGIATDTIQALYYSEELLDTSVETVTSSMSRNIRAMQQAASGSETYKAAYDRLGVSVTDANGELRDSEEVFWEMIDALGQIENSTERDSVAMTVFGRSAQSLNSLVAAGSKGFKEMYQEADRLGYILDQDTLDGLTATSDALERVDKTLDTVKNQIGAEVAPVVEEAATKLQEILLENKDTVADLVADVIPALVDGLEFVVDNLDRIVPAITGIAGGYVAFQALSAGTTLVNTAMALFAPAAETATAAQEGLNVAMTANPAGAVAAAIGLLMTGLTAYLAMAEPAALQAVQLTEEAQAMVDAASKVNESALQTAQARQSTWADMDTQKARTQELTDRLKDLAGKTELTVEEQQEMKTVVGELNALMPELNLQYNEQTNELNMSTEAIEANVDALMRRSEAAAYEEQLTELYRERVEIETEMAQMEDEVAAARERAVEAITSYNAANDALNESIENNTSDQRELAAAAQEAYLAMEEAVRQVDAVGGPYDDLSDRLQQVDADLETVNARLSDTGSYEEAEAAVASLNTEILDYRGTAYEVTGDVASYLSDLSTAYEDAKTAALDSINTQIGLFDELSLKSDRSVDQMVADLQSQTASMQTYSQDMEKAAQLVRDGLMEEGLLGTLQEMGTSGAGYLHELVTAAETDVDAFNEVMEAWAENQETRDALASTMADVQTGYSEAWEEILGTTEETTGELDEDLTEAGEDIADIADESLETLADTVEAKSGGVTGAVEDLAEDVVAAAEEQMGYSTFREIGSEAAQGFVAGLLSRRSAVREAATSLAEEASGATRKKLDINSPSKVFEYFGEMSGEGFAEGLENTLPEINSLVDGLMPEEQPAAQQQQAGGYVNMPTINVYPSEGQDEEAIAEEVMNRMTEDYDKKEAQWR